MPTVVEMLRADTSKYALKPDDPEMLVTLVSRVAEATDAGVPETTSKKDAGYWKDWRAYCALWNTSQWRDDADANSGSNAAGHTREIILQTGFMLWYYDKMKPRRKDRSQADPRGAHKAVQAVRRIHKGRGYAMPSAPTVGKALNGLLSDYVRLHGSAALAPQRKEPLTTEQTEKILNVPDGTRLSKKHVVDWESDIYVCFACLLTALRHCGARKADHLPVRDSEFDGRHMARSNLTWQLRGEKYADAPPELLRDLREGDCAVLKPASCKNDPTGTTFGDRPMHLPYVAGDATNAAARFAQLELRMPVHGTARKNTPLYTIDPVTSLDHETADALFHGLAVAALGEEVAATLSLHSGRVWLACALLERGESPATIQAMCRWRSPESVKVYARMTAENYAGLLCLAMKANVDASLVRSLPTLDSDARFAKLERALYALEARVARGARASAAATPAATTADGKPHAESDSDESDDGEDDDDEPPPKTCSAGGLLPAELVTVGRDVAVPFRVDGREAMCPGSITSAKPGRILVRFEDGTFEVNANRLFEIAA